MNRSSLCTTFLVTAIFAVPAQANIILDETASVDQSGIFRQVGYNSSGVYDNGPGFHVFNSPCVPGGCVSYSLTNSGLTDTQGSATSGFISSHADVTLQYGGPVYNSPYFNVGSSANAFAGASIDSATVRASANGTFLDSYPNPNSGQNGGAGRAFAQYNDLLHFSVAGASANTTTLIGISYTLDGFFSGSTGSGSLNNFLDFGGGHLRDSYGFRADTQVSSVDSTLATGWASYNFVSNTPGLLIFNGVYALTGPQTDVYTEATLDALCAIGTTCDYSHTGQFRITSIASNVTYTSDSGVFLTAQPASAPEPATWGLFGTGLAALLFLRKKLA